MIDIGKRSNGNQTVKNFRFNRIVCFSLVLQYLPQLFIIPYVSQPNNSIYKSNSFIPEILASISSYYTLQISTQIQSQMKIKIKIIYTRFPPTRQYQNYSLSRVSELIIYLEQVSCDQHFIHWEFWLPPNTPAGNSRPVSRRTSVFREDGVQGTLLTRFKMARDSCLVFRRTVWFLILHVSGLRFCACWYYIIHSFCLFSVR